MLGEDFWPVRLDDDYQDAVIAYNYGFKLDINNNVRLLRVTLDPIAAGGVIDIGVGLRIPINAGNPHIISASIGGVPTAIMQVPSDPDITNHLVLDLRAALFPGQGTIVNANPNNPTVANAGPIEVIIEFFPAAALDVFGAPFDAFFFRSNSTSHEIHLSQYCGTAAMNNALFGTGIDNSNVPGGPCYVDNQGLPSLLAVPDVVLYPTEATDISLLYPQIVAWAASGGTVNQGWYQNPNPAFGYPTPLSPAFNGQPGLFVDLSCPCPSGYTLQGGGGHVCLDDDECAMGTDNCNVNATCTNTEPGFSCACNPGFTGDGVTCTPTNSGQCGDGVLQSGEERDPPPGPFSNTSLDNTCRWRFANAPQLYCNGTCTWAGGHHCDQADADVFCKLRTGNPNSVATQWTTTTALPTHGFPCARHGYGTPLGGNNVVNRVGSLGFNITWQDSSILANHGAGTVIPASGLVCTP